MNRQEAYERLMDELSIALSVWGWTGTGVKAISLDAVVGDTSNSQAILTAVVDGHEFAFVLSYHEQKDHSTMADEVEEVGELGLPFSKIGSVVQSLGRGVVDRGNLSSEQVTQYLTSEAFNEDYFWDEFGGPALDWIEDQVGDKISDELGWVTVEHGTGVASDVFRYGEYIGQIGHLPQAYSKGIWKARIGRDTLTGREDEPNWLRCISRLDALTVLVEAHIAETEKES